ncbi:hypothetical protein [Nocardia sp. NPDC004860]|uniref:hypothetical protein n=1 Tax=Nocardia sp. NPDC004860 TaxID=3154557 RepID=UPI0033BB547F
MSEDPELAQARMFLAELEYHAECLVRRRSQWRDDKPNQAVEVELVQVHRQIGNLRQRFTDLRRISRWFRASEQRNGD